MNSIVVEEQEQEEGSESETIDLDCDTLLNVLKRVDEFTLARAACVNKLWRKTAQDERLWEPIAIRLVLRSGGYGLFDVFREKVSIGSFRRFRHLCPRPLSKPPPLDFYSIDPTVFTIQPFSDVAPSSSKMVDEMVYRLPWQNAADAILCNETSQGNQERMHNE